MIFNPVITIIRTSRTLCFAIVFSSLFSREVDSTAMSILPEELLLDPAARVRMLSNAGSSVVVDAKIPALRYYRSGPQMEKMVLLQVFLSCTHV